MFEALRIGEQLFEVAVDMLAGVALRGAHVGTLQQPHIGLVEVFGRHRLFARPLVKGKIHLQPAGQALPGFQQHRIVGPFMDQAVQLQRGFDLAGGVKVARRLLHRFVAPVEFVEEALVAKRPGPLDREFVQHLVERIGVIDVLGSNVDDEGSGVGDAGQDTLLHQLAHRLAQRRAAHPHLLCDPEFVEFLPRLQLAGEDRPLEQRHDLGPACRVRDRTEIQLCHSAAPEGDPREQDKQIVDNLTRPISGGSWPAQIWRRGRLIAVCRSHPALGTLLRLLASGKGRARRSHRPRRTPRQDGGRVCCNVH